MVKEDKFVKGLVPFDVLMFIIFNNQFTIKLTQRRNYRHTNYYLLDSIFMYNWVFWRKHSQLNPIVQLDLIAYNNNVNLHVLTKPLFMEKYILLYKFFSYRSNRHFFLISALEQRFGGLAKLWPSCTYYEREVYELFGITTNQMVDRRRLLLDYCDFTTPMASEFDVFGKSEIRYSLFSGTPVFTSNTLFNI